MVDYCFNKSTCKRQLIATHFREKLWSTNGKCNKMCDVCNSASSINEIDCIAETEILFNLLEKHSGKEKRLTANKLAELCANEVGKSSKTHLVNKMSRFHVEQMILELLLKNFLTEEFAHTPYSTICYLVREKNRAPPRGSFKISVLQASKFGGIKSSAENSGVVKIDNAKNNDNVNVKKSVFKNNKIQEEIDVDFVEITTKSPLKSKSNQKLVTKREAEREVFILDSDEDDTEESRIFFKKSRK